MYQALGINRVTMKRGGGVGKDIVSIVRGFIKQKPRETSPVMLVS